MILVDTGPLVALFDAADPAHARCQQVLDAIHEPVVTTVPVLTEALYLLEPDSRGSRALQEFTSQGGLRVWFLSEGTIGRAFELMRRYADHPMDLADASLVVAAETLRTTTVFTLDRNDFATYRVRVGRSWRRFRVLG